MTVADVASKMGWSRSTLFRRIKQIDKWSDMEIEGLASALGLTRHELMHQIDPTPHEPRLDEALEQIAIVDAAMKLRGKDLSALAREARRMLRLQGHVVQTDLRYVRDPIAAQEADDISLTEADDLPGLPGGTRNESRGSAKKRRE